MAPFGKVVLLCHRPPKVTAPICEQDEAVNRLSALPIRLCHDVQLSNILRDGLLDIDEHHKDEQLLTAELAKNKLWLRTIKS